MRAVIEKYGLFTITDDNKFFFSYSLNRRMLKANEKRDKLRANALKRWHGEDDTKAMQLHSKSNADLMPVKERKVNESKLNSTTTACARACEDDDEKKSDVAQSLVNSDLAAVNRYWDENVSPITPAIAREFESLLQKGIKADIILAAISEAIRSATGRPSYNYVKTIIDRWIAQGIDTLAKVKEDREKHGTKANGKGAIEYEVGKDGIKHDSAGHVVL
jgi:DnaD/phage-associated family protein